MQTYMDLDYLVWLAHVIALKWKTAANEWRKQTDWILKAAEESRKEMNNVKEIGLSSLPLFFPFILHFFLEWRWRIMVMVRWSFLL